LKDGATIELTLAKPGENSFKVFVFDVNGGPIALDQDKIMISRTAASVDAIPASHSIAVAAREKIGGRLILVYLVKEGDQLPKKGKLVFKAEESLKAGSSESLNFQILEGDIEEPISDNRFIGLFKITGKDFTEGVIAAGADLICEYEVLDSGNIIMEVSVPSIRGSFHSGRSYYSRQEGQIDYSKASKLVQEQVELTLERLSEMESKIQDPRLDLSREKLEQAESLKSGESDPEDAKQALDNVQEAKRLLALSRKAHLKEIRQLELEKVVEFFDEVVRQHARPSEESAFDNLARTAQRAIDNNSGDFEVYLDELRGKNFSILWRQDWFVIDRFKYLTDATYLFADAEEHAQIVEMGIQALKANDIEQVRKVVAQLSSIKIGTAGVDEMMANANIIRS
jgi:molecular chaperone DnaK